MKGLCWESFKEQAVASMCKDCEYGHAKPWRGDMTCIQTWLRFHSSRGLILACNAARAGKSHARPEDGLMHEHSNRESMVHS
jgi:hypothetical protein